MATIDSSTPQQNQENLIKALKYFNSLGGSAINELIDRKHPYYEKYQYHWTFCAETYAGGREWFKKHIFPFYKEGKVEYEGRVKRAYRPNHTKEVVDLVNKYIFKIPITRKDDAPDFLKKFWNTTTLNGRKIDDFMRLVSLKASIYGRVWVVVDSSFPMSNTPISIGNVKEKSQIYAYILDPEDVYDYAYDELGNLTWMKIKERVREDFLLGGDGDVTERFRIWTRDYWILFEETTNEKNETEYKIVDAKTHDLGVIPIIDCCHTITENMYQANSLIDDVAYLDRAAANYLSNLDTIIQDQTFSQLVIPAQALNPEDEADSSNKKIIELGTKRIFTYNAEANMPPTYIAPDPKQAALVVDAVKTIINEIYHTVGMSGERTKQDNSLGIDNSSGVAKAYDFERMNAMLASKAQSLEYFENRLASIVAIYNSKSEEVDGKEYVAYPANFDIRSLYDEFEIAKQLKDISAPDEVRRQQMVQLSKKLFPTISDAVAKTIESEIKTKWVIDPVEQAIKISQATVQSTNGSNTDTKTTQQNQQGQNNKQAPKTTNSK